jgi:hypothetical protein
MKQLTIKLTKVEAEYILNLIDDNIREGFYYGNKTQYLTRAELIKENLLQTIIEQKG